MIVPYGDSHKSPIHHMAHTPELVVTFKDGGFPTVATGNTRHALWREPLLVMHRCGRSLLSKPPTKFFRRISSTTTPAADSTTPPPRPNALTLIHKTSALLPSILSPTPKHAVESLKLWTELLDYAHNASVIHGGSAGSGDRKARIVGAFIPRSFSQPHTFSLLTSNVRYSAWSALGLGRV